MAQAAAAAPIIGTAGSLIAGRRQAKSQQRSQRALIAEQKKTQAEERARLAREETEQNKKDASRSSVIQNIKKRGQGATLFAGRTGVTTNLLGGGTI